MTHIRVTMQDIRSARMCSSGAREFFKKHNLDWLTFLKEGLPVEQIEATGDAMALEVAEVARGQKQ